MLKVVPQLAAVFEAPEERAVVVARAVAWQVLRRAGVSDDVGERALQQARTASIVGSTYMGVA